MLRTFFGFNSQKLRTLEGLAEFQYFLKEIFDLNMEINQKTRIAYLADIMNVQT